MEMVQHETEGESVKAVTLTGYREGAKTWLNDLRGFKDRVPSLGYKG
jgi:hypothetical protein